MEQSLRKLSPNTWHSDSLVSTKELINANQTMSCLITSSGNMDATVETVGVEADRLFQVSTTAAKCTTKENGMLPPIPPSLLFKEPAAFWLVLPAERILTVVPSDTMLLLV